MKIALLGSAGSVVKAPFLNEAYAEWVQGKVSSVARAHAQIGGEWDIWGCSPGCWAVTPRATRWFEVHRWEPGQPWFTPEYCQFLRDFKGKVYTGARIPEIPNHVVYPIDRMEEKFSSYNMTSSIALMLALAIDEIEEHRKANPQHDPNEDVIGLWGIDMAAAEEYSYQRPGCQNFVLEAMRRGIGVYLPPESDLMRPMPVYGVSEWDHNYIKLTDAAKRMSKIAGEAQAAIAENTQRLATVQGEQHALQAFVSTWTSQYGMMHGMVIRQAPGTGMGSGITHFDGRPVARMALGAPEAPAAADPDATLGRELVAVLQAHTGETGVNEGAVETLRRIISERDAAAPKPRKKAARKKR